MPPFLDKLAANWPAGQWRDVTVLVAVSGGADSVALLRGLARLREPGEGRLIVAHCNHGLRGADSDGDQALVEELAASLGIECVVGERRLEVTGGHAGEGLESLARQARYDFLAQAADRAGARYVATAHTADDQAETILLQVLRGTGLAGLAGIPRVRRLTGGASLVRPLLEVTRAEVLAWLAELGQYHREDASNARVDFTRNRIRHELLPQLERDYNPQIRTALRRLASIAEEAESYLNAQADELLGRVARPIAGGVELDLALVRREPETIARQALRRAWRGQGWPLADMSHEKWGQLWQMTWPDDDAPARQMFPGEILAERTAARLRLTGKGC
ncbi:MAG: tRNA lysidine(34) synthetase TilS [Pirellulaceae bacterium]|nr:tRNA lysidine(34) synthetase TilS [Pirellulaceae bacterium]